MFTHIAKYPLRLLVQLFEEPSSCIRGEFKVHLAADNQNVQTEVELASQCVAGPRAGWNEERPRIAVGDKGRITDMKYRKRCLLPIVRRFTAFWGQVVNDCKPCKQIERVVRAGIAGRRCSCSGVYAWNKLLRGTLRSSDAVW